ncbi:MAG: hypothetical protein QOE03_3252 [Micromonosporaceae bacterium]|nr:hypothetical protein [Micromonosporaceae bacterium]
MLSGASVGVRSGFGLVVTDDWRTAWIHALDAVEAEVAQVEALLEDDHRARDTPAYDPWTPPEGLGPLPLELAPRADAILARQLAAAQSVVLAISTNRQQALLASRIESGRQATPLPPAYHHTSM